MGRRGWFSIAGVGIAAAVLGASRVGGLTPEQSWTAAVTTLCAVWWMSEAMPLAATSLVPLAVFPLTGVLREREAAAAYGDPIVLLFMGGFMLSKAAERSGAHRRIAETMVACIGGGSGQRLVLAFMLATALCSMWISNTATVLMMMPVVLAVLEQNPSRKLGIALLLGIAYSASIGGIATPIGTPPNGIFLAVYRNVTDQSVPFHQWMLLATPVAITLLLATWLVLTWRVGDEGAVAMTRGKGWTTAQRRTLIVFGLAALAWVTREVPFGGWSSWFGSTTAGDMSVAIAAVIALFLIRNGEKDGDRLLDWTTAVTIPWGVLILFGGGLAIATAFESTGLSAVVGEAASGIREFPPLAIIAVVSLTVTFLSEFTSNTATSNILMPILAATALANGMDPALLMIPATLANSLAFMMPVGTPPNAIIFGTGHVRIADMVRFGLVLNFVGVAIVTVFCWWLLPMVFGVEVAGG